MQVWPRTALGLLACAGVLACGPSKLPGLTGSEHTSTSEDTGPSTSDSGPATEAGSVGEDSGSESAGDAQTDTSGTDGESSDTGPQCGDGVVDPDESCDDGNLVGGDGCPADCVIPPIVCSGQVYECGDTLDNDDDGWVDLYDPECTSPCDDDESSFALNLPSQGPDCA